MNPPRGILLGGVSKIEIGNRGRFQGTGSGTGAGTGRGRLAPHIERLLLNQSYAGESGSNINLNLNSTLGGRYKVSQNQSFSMGLTQKLGGVERTPPKLHPLGLLGEEGGGSLGDKNIMR